MASKAVFTLASGRSGTHFLYELIRRNAVDCVAHHETYGYNPSMFSRPIYDFTSGDRTRTRQLLARKQRIVERCRAETYVETSHAFLKSWFDLACEHFPRLKLVHLIRDPLKVAKSEANRERTIKWLRLPFCHYRGGDGQRYFLWSLTGREPIFKPLEQSSLSRFQWYVIQWIEIENRAMRFLAEFSKQADCFTLHSPVELNDTLRVSALFDFLGIKLRHREPDLGGRHNKNWRPTIIADDDRRQLEAVIEAMPGQYLDIFRREPYVSLSWAASLAKVSR